MTGKHSLSFHHELSANKSSEPQYPTAQSLLVRRAPLGGRQAIQESFSFPQEENKQSVCTDNTLPASLQQDNLDNDTNHQRPLTQNNLTRATLLIGRPLGG